jgi:diacylglycerol kinase (ATP)
VRVKVILNPYANRWGAKARAPKIRAALDAAGVNYDLSFIPAPGQGKEEAMKAVETGYDAVVAAGGDGTVHEVVNGLIASANSQPTIPMGVIPVGTGNDFNDMAKLPRDLNQAAQIIAAGNTRQVDAGRVIADGVTHHFDNNCAVAMEPLVTLENVRMTRLSGNIRYVVAVVKALIKLKAWQMRVTWDGGGQDGPVFLLSICNSPRVGGIFHMAPGALTDDGLFNYVYVPEVSKATVLALVPRLVGGSHIHHPRVTYGHTSRITIESEPGTPIHADGELLAESAKHIIYDILPGKITLLATQDY